MSLFVNVPLAPDKTYLIEEYIHTGRDYPYHFHPEYELTIRMKSFGHRVIGDHIAPYYPGDCVLVGPNLPHQWKKDERFKVAGGMKDYIYVLKFREDFLGEELMKRIEMLPVKELFERSKLGISFSPETTDQVYPLIKQLLDKEYLNGIILLLQIIQILCEAREYQVLASPGFVESKDDAGRTQITQIVRFILENFDKDISASSTAERFHMQLSTFSHYFKTRTGKTFVKFLNEVRLGHASRLLLESDLYVSEICYQSGFKNMSNFNRHFKRQYNLAPREYRRELGVRK